MRTRIVSALCVVLPLICSPRPAAAQFNPSVPQLPQASFRKLPSPPKLSEFQRATESRPSGLRSDLRDESANVLQSLRNLLTQRESGKAIGGQSLVEARQCAHIVIFEAPNMDSQMIIEAPKELAGDMPRLQGVQACGEDFGKEVALLQAVPFVDPGKFGTLAPKAEMRFDGRGFLFPRQTPGRVGDRISLPFVRPAQLAPEK
jgi:hypothetical protein